MNDAGGSTQIQAVVLAAGKGTRMKSDLPKVLHELAGRPLLAHVLATVRGAGIHRTVVVVGHQADLVRDTCAAADLVFVTQEPQLGTGHAVQVAETALDAGGYTVVLSGDVPLLRSRTLRALVDGAIAADAAAAVLTCVVADAGAYGRIIKDGHGAFQAIVEARDATAEQLAVSEFNTGIYCYRTVDLIAALGMLSDDNDQHEYYLTDTIAHLAAAGRPVVAVAAEDPDEVVGINTVAELEAAAGLLARRGGRD